MKAGLGKAEMTPPLGVELAGYGYYLQRRATRVDDPLWARALALEDEGERYVVISCDVLGLNTQVVAQVREHLIMHLRVPADHFTLVSIHTHTGPALKYHEGCGEVDADYLATAAAPIIAACGQALASLAEVTALYNICTELKEAYAYNRAREDGPVDRLVRGFRIERSGFPSIAVVSYACHPVARGRSTGISADYPGQVCRLLEDEGLLPLYLNGVCGDIDPISVPEEARPAQLEAFAQTIVSAYHEKANPCSLTVKGSHIPWTLRLTPVRQSEIRETAAQAAAKAADEGARRVALTWEREMLEKLGTLAAQEAIYISCLCLGGVCIAALPFEAFTQTGMQIRKRLRDARTLVLGCAEELLGYLPTRDDIARGAYAALESTFLYKRLPPLPGEAERLGEELGDRLRSEFK